MAPAVYGGHHDDESSPVVKTSRRRSRNSPPSTDNGPGPSTKQASASRRPNPVERHQSDSNKSGDTDLVDLVGDDESPRGTKYQNSQNAKGQSEGNPAQGQPESVPSALP